MTPTGGQIKQITLRWSEEFWDRAKIAAHQRRMSLQTAATLGCAQVLGIEPPEMPSEQEPQEA